MTPNSTASTRTKNRLREHTPDGHGASVVKETDSCEPLKGVPALLLKCALNCDWSGWIPKSEVTL